VNPTLLLVRRVRGTMRYMKYLSILSREGHRGVSVRPETGAGCKKESRGGGVERKQAKGSAIWYESLLQIR